MKILRFTYLISLLLCSCTIGSVKPYKPYGDIAKVTLRIEQEDSCELLAVSDSFLYYRDDRGYGTVPLTEIEKVNVMYYNNRTASKICCGSCCIVSELAITFAAFSNEEPVWGVVSIAAAVGTAVFFRASFLTSANPKTNFVFPLNYREFKILKLYCRYPQGLSPEQWAELKGTRKGPPPGPEGGE